MRSIISSLNDALLTNAYTAWVLSDLNRMTLSIKNGADITTATSSAYSSRKSMDSSLQQTHQSAIDHTSSGKCGAAMHPSPSGLILLHLLQPPLGD